MITLVNRTERQVLGQVFDVFMRFVDVIVRYRCWSIIDWHFNSFYGCSIFLNQNILLDFGHLGVFWYANLLIDNL